MCAPASVTALHQLVAVNAFQAYMVSHIMGISGLVGAALLCFKGSIFGKLSQFVGKFGK